MNAIAKIDHGGTEIIPPGEGIHLVFAGNPFGLDATRLVAPAGLTVRELIDFAEARSEVRRSVTYRVFLDGHFLLEEHRDRVRPKPGTVLVVRAVAQGGGDNSLIRNLLLVAVAAAGLLIPGAIGLTGIAASLLGAAVTLGGSLLVNMLFPVTQPKLDRGTGISKSTAYAIGGSSNEARPFGVIPTILGTSRVYPKLGANWYTEFAGGDQYLIGLLVFGYGPLSISSIKIGETPIESFEDVDIEVREGYDSDAAITLYPRDVDQQDLSIELTHAGGWESRTSAADTDVLSLDFVAPAGLVRVDKTGKSQTYTVSLRIEYSPTGAGTWSLLSTIDLKARATDAIRKNVRKKVTRGQYDVRVSKTSSDYSGTESVTDSVVWTALRSFTNEAPIDFGDAPLAKMAIRIRANSQLNGAIDDLNAICQSRVVSWSGSAWVADTVSSRPGDLFRHVLQGPANKRPADDAQVDLTTLEAWNGYCETKGWEFDMERDFSASVSDTLKDIAAAGRATVLLRDGKWSVAWDDPESAIVQHFTPRNSWGFTGQRAYRTMPHGLRIRFVNRDKGYAQDERIVYADGYNAGNATIFEAIELVGQTDSDNVWKHGRFHYAQALLRPEVYSLNVDIEHLVATRGDRARVAHDVPMWGLAQGRIKAIDGLVLTLDEPVTMTAGHDYVIRFRLRDGDSVVTPVVFDDGVNSTITIESPTQFPAAGDLFMFGEVDEETVVLRVLGITPAADGSARVTLVDDAPEISSADSGTIPAFDSQITVPTDPLTAAPVNLVVREALQGVGGDDFTGAQFSWETLAGSAAIGFQAEVRDDDGAVTWRGRLSTEAPVKSVTFEHLDDGNWSFRVRAVFESGRTSGWTEIAAVLTGLAGLTVDDIANLRASYIDGRIDIEWDSVTSNWPVKYEIRKGDTWAAGILSDTIAEKRFTPVGDGTYWIKALIEPSPGVLKYSTDAESIVISGAALVDNVVSTIDEVADGWHGTITGPGAISGSNFVTTAAGTVAYYEIPSSNVIDVGFARPTQLSVNFTATAVRLDADVLTDPDFLNNPDVLSSSSSAFIEAWIEVAISQVGSNDAFAPTDIFAEADAFLAGTVFGDWVKFKPGDYLGRWFKFRVALKSNDDAVQAVVTAFEHTVDVPDRLDHVNSYALLAAGSTFTFAPDADPLTARAFNGGPYIGNLPMVFVDIVGGAAGDTVLVTGRTLSQVTVQVTNGGVGVARTVNLIFQGW